MQTGQAAFACPCLLGLCLRLSSKGYKFVSQTDTELLAHLVQDMQAVCWTNLRDCLLQDLKKQMEGATYTEVQLVGFITFECCAYADFPDASQLPCGCVCVCGEPKLQRDHELVTVSM